MRSLKRPLSILIAALMLVSVMVIAPVTANATVIDSGTINAVGRWVSTENISYNDSGYDYMIYPRNTLGDRIIITRMNPNAATVPSWDAVWSQTDDIEIPTDTSGGNNNWIFASNWSEQHIYYSLSGHHGTSSDNYVCVQIFNEYGSIKQNLWTYDFLHWTFDDNGVLTITGEGAIADVDDPSHLPWKDHINDITEVVVSEGITGIGDNVLVGCEEKEISLPSTMTDLETYKNLTLTRDDEDPMLSVAGFPTTVKKLETLGVQSRTVEDSPAFRFVTIADSDLLKAADDYGYIVAKTETDVSTALTNAGQLTVANTPAKNKYSCKNTSNNFAGKWGSSNLNESGYKYISCIVTGAPAGVTILSRFYITLDGTTYTYSTYTNGSTYDGCAYAL